MNQTNSTLHLKKLLGRILLIFYLRLIPGRSPVDPRLVWVHGPEWTWSWPGPRLGPGSDVQWKIPVPSLPYGFKLFPPGNFPYGNSREIPEIREFPVLQESQEFPSHGNFPFLSAHISDFPSVFYIRKLVL